MTAAYRRHVDEPPPQQREGDMMTTTTETPKPLDKVSITKLTTFQACPLKGYYAFVLNLPQPENKSKQTGIELHEVAERYLRDGTPPHDGRIGALFKAGMGLLPQPGTCRVEEWIGLAGLGKCEAFPEGVNLVGKSDYFQPVIDQRILTAPEKTALARMKADPSKVLFVGDHKTTSDFKWALSSSQLAEDPQMLTYAYAVAVANMQEAPQAIVLEHVQYRTKGMPLAKRERAVVTWEKCENMLNRVDAWTRDALMLSCKGVSDVEVPQYARPEACGMYGGCPFSERCPFSPVNREGRRNPTMPTQNVSDAALARRAKLMGGSAPAAPAAPAKAPAPTAPKTPAPTAPKTPAPTAPKTPAPTAPKARFNPADAAASKPPVDPAEGVRVLTENLKVANGKYPAALARKVIASIGCDFDAVMALGSFVIEGNVLVKAVVPEPVPESVGNVDGLTYEMADDGQWYVYADGEPLQDTNGEFYAFATEAEARAAFEQTSEAAEAAESEEAAASEYAVECFGETDYRAYYRGMSIGNFATEDDANAACIAHYEGANSESSGDGAFVESEAFGKLDAPTRAAIYALRHTAAESNGVVKKDVVDAIIKEKCGIKRLTDKARSSVVDAGIETGAFYYHGEGLSVSPPTEDGEVTVVVTDPQPTAKPSPTPNARPADSGPLVLLVDAYPSAGKVYAVDVWSAMLQTLEDEVCAAQRVEHINLVEYKKGGAMVASKLLVNLTRVPPTGWWSISSRVLYAEEIVQVFQRLGAVVVRGL